MVCSEQLTRHSQSMPLCCQRLRDMLPVRLITSWMQERLKASGAVLSDQVKSMDWRARGASLLCRAPEGTVREVLNKVGTLRDV